MTAALATATVPILGSTTPRIWTPPLIQGPPGPCGCGCPLTTDTSYGFRASEFAEYTLRFPFDPWERWTVIHAGELLPDGRPRFRVVILLVARQNGKSTIPVVLSLYWQFIESLPMTLITSTKLEYAKKTWLRGVKLAERAAKRDDQDGRDLRNLIPKRRNGEPHWYKEGNNDIGSWTTEDCVVTVAAANEDAGRSLSLNRWFGDEVRQQHDYSVWEAAEPTTSAVWGSQIWLASNAGDHRSIVLNDQRDQALLGALGLEPVEAAALLDRTDVDPRVGIIEYSAKPGADPEDPAALASANPNLNRRRPDGSVGPQLEDLVAKARAAKRKGGDALNSFKVNYMCQSVNVDDPAIDPYWWEQCHLIGSLDDYRGRVAMVLDVSFDERAADLYAAAMVDERRSRVDAVKSWEGTDCLAQVRKDLPGLLARLKPAKFGWFPTGPAAALAATLKDRKQHGWPPRGVEVEELRGEVSAVCMGFASRVVGTEVLHSGDPRLDAQVAVARKLEYGATWVYRRKGGGYVQALYAAAGADHLARTLPPPSKPSKPRLVTV